MPSGNPLVLISNSNARASEYMSAVSVSCRRRRKKYQAREEDVQLYTCCSHITYIGPTEKWKKRKKDAHDMTTGIGRHRCSESQSSTGSECGTDRDLSMVQRKTAAAALDIHMLPYPWFARKARMNKPDLNRNKGIVQGGTRCANPLQWRWTTPFLLIFRSSP